MSEVFGPQMGEPPILEWVSLEMLRVDARYQRGLEAKSSQNLIRDIARGWNWDLCQPLSVSRRGDESLWVMDGQHRLAGAVARGDIPRLPCIITPQNSVQAEASTFVNLNRRRRPLGSVDVFKANLAAGAGSAVEVMQLIEGANLVIAPHSNYTAWRPRMIYCVPGIQSAYRRFGATITSQGLHALAAAFDGHVLRYGGQLLRALFVVFATEGRVAGFDEQKFIDRLAMNSQQQWMRKANEAVARTGDGIIKALVDVLIDAYRKMVSHG